VNLDQNFPAAGVVDFEHAVRRSEDNFDVRQARFEHDVLLLLGKSSLSELYFNNHGERERERENCSKARDVDENARKFAERGTSFSVSKRSLSLVLYLLRIHLARRVFFLFSKRERESQRDRETEREFMKRF